jgi:hypothetical protein
MNLVSMLFQPFHRIAGAASLGLGLAALLIAALLGWAQGLHFDGVLDAHLGGPAPWWFFVAEGLVSWLSLALLLLGAGLILSKSAFRGIDLLGTQALARWPMVPAALAALAPGFHRYSAALLEALTQMKPGGAIKMPPGGLDAGVFALVTVGMLACLVWMVALMWQSFSLCCNVRGGRAVAGFILALLAAEAVSKTLIVWMAHALL